MQQALSVSASPAVPASALVPSTKPALPDALDASQTPMALWQESSINPSGTMSASPVTISAIDEYEVLTLTLTLVPAEPTDSAPVTDSHESPDGTATIGSESSTYATSASPSIKIAAIPSIVIKPVVPTTVVLPTATSTAAGTSTTAPTGSNDFLESLGQSPVSIALTTLVCTGILVLVAASIAFFVRRCRKQTHRKRRIVSGITVQQEVGRYSDNGSDVMRETYAVSLPADRYRTIGQQRFNPVLAENHQPVQATGHNLIDMDVDEKLQDEIDWNNAMLQERRRSSVDLSLVQHLQASHPFSAPSVQGSSASRIFNYAPTIASSAYLDPSPSQQTRFGRQSYPSMPAPSATAVQFLQVPARPDRPASLTSSFTHAVDEALSLNPPAPPQYAASPVSAPSTQLWPARALNQVVGMVNSYMPASPNYDEERADQFTSLPAPIRSGRRPSTRWGSFASVGSAAPDRKVHQQMPSRFSVTTLGTNMTNSPPQSVDGSVYSDWHIRSAQRLVVNAPQRRAAPRLIAQATPAQSGSGSDSGSDTADLRADEPAEIESASENEHQWASTQPLALAHKPDLSRLASTRSVATVQSSIFSQVDAEEDGYGMTEEEQSAMRELIRKRRAAAAR